VTNRFHPDILRAFGFDPDAPVAEPITNPAAAFGELPEAEVMLALARYSALRGIDISLAGAARPFLCGALTGLSQRPTVREALAWRIVTLDEGKGDWEPAANWDAATQSTSRPEPTWHEVRGLLMSVVAKMKAAASNLQYLAKVKEAGSRQYNAIQAEHDTLKTFWEKFPADMREITE
jgi:hypothetical protein